MASFTSAEALLVEEKDLNRLHDTLAYAYTNGIIMGIKPTAGSAGQASRSTAAIHASHAPYALYPFRYPRASFELATSLAKGFNRLMHSVASDADWVAGVLKETVKADPFTARLLKIMLQMEKERKDVVAKPFQSVSLGILRSDYMLHSREGDDRGFLQVEINTIASSFGCISSKMAQMYTTIEAPDVYNTKNIPKNDAVAGIARGIALAQTHWLSQLKTSPTSSSSAAAAVAVAKGVVVLMIVQPGETNFCDQRLLHFALKELFGVDCLRASLADVHAHAYIAPDGHLVYRGRHVSVCYFRAGYQPIDYPSEDDWSARVMMERSLAIKCPDIYLHLAGTKKVQQELARPGAVERYLPADEAAAIRRCFAGLYSLDSQEDVDAAKNLVEKNLHGYVLKPQREGGGNNFFSEQARDMLTTQTLAELQAYILMERIEPPAQSAVMVRNCEVMRASCICELGVYGVYVADRATPLTPTVDYIHSDYAGYLLRVKPANVDEGGVAAGFALLGTPVFEP